MTNIFDLTAAIPLADIKAGLAAAAAIFVVPVVIKWGFRKVVGLFGN